MVQTTRIKNSLILLFACTLLCMQGLSARELRTPLSFLYYWWTQYPLERPIDEETCWQFELLGGAYHRESADAFLDKNTTKKEPLSGIMFNKPDFTLNEAFPDGVVPTDLLIQNPLLNAAVISPRISYNENGAYWGFAFDREICNSCWRVGVRGTLPVRRINVELDDCCDLAETLDDMIDVSCDVLADGTVIQSSYAFRLDFLSSLRTCGGARVVTYGNGDPAAVAEVRNTQVAGVRLSNDANTNFPAHVKKSAGRFPAKPYSARGVTTGNLTNLPDAEVPNLSSTGNGSLRDNDRRKFNSNTNYTGAGNLETLKENQRMLWVVPTVRTDNQITGGGNDIRDIIVGGCPENGICISGLLDQLGPNDGPINFLQAQGINFRSTHLVGLGDFITQFYANWANDCYFFEGVFGIVWPTGRREKDSGDLLRVLFPRGNNKHFEVQFAALGGWDRWDWLKIKADALYAHAIKRNEHVAAAFAGETVKNIGPDTCADVSWNYFVTDIDFTFVHPKNCDLGFDVGYQAYIKLEDNISFKETQAMTLGGTLVNLDPSVLESRTDVVAHKLRLQGFWQTDYLRVYGGWNHVFAGKNAPRETDWYLAAGIYF